MTFTFVEILEIEKLKQKQRLELSKLEHERKIERLNLKLQIVKEETKASLFKRKD